LTFSFFSANAGFDYVLCCCVGTTKPKMMTYRLVYPEMVSDQREKAAGEAALLAAAAAAAICCSLLLLRTLS
jgi:hypothetical protein